MKLASESIDGNFSDLRTASRSGHLVINRPHVSRRTSRTKRLSEPCWSTAARGRRRSVALRGIHHHALLRHDLRISRWAATVQPVARSIPQQLVGRDSHDAWLEPASSKIELAKISARDGIDCLSNASAGTNVNGNGAVVRLRRISAS